MPSNFDFGGFINDDNRFEEADDMSSFEDQLSVEAVLKMKFGDKGKRVYATLCRLAKKAAANDGGAPGIIFTEDGGQFVSFHNAGDRDYDE